MLAAGVDLLFMNHGLGHMVGLDVHDPAIAGLFPRGGRLFLLGQERLFSFPYAGRAARLPNGQAALTL